MTQWTGTAWRRTVGAVALAMSLCAGVSAQVIMKEVPDPMKGIAQENKLGEQLPMDIRVINWEGQSVEIGDYFKSGKPVVLALVYYSCPMMCPLVMQRLQERINDLPYIVGEDYKLVVVSFDTSEKPALASSIRSGFLAGYKLDKNPIIEKGLLFHVAEADSIHRLANAVGFKYEFIAETGQYAHGSALTVLTGEGKVSRYVDGLAAEKSELRMALLEATEGKIANSIGDLFLHFCYRWDPSTGKYTMQAMRVMQVGAVGTMLGLGTLILTLHAGDRVRRRLRERPRHTTIPTASAPQGAGA